MYCSPITSLTQKLILWRMYSEQNCGLKTAEN